ncbi:MAG TPA: iron ABC transporter permease [Acidimicrobiia bacterium]|nr:iron ABC transporter permease [Acidimicrobiia bacterium]
MLGVGLAAALTALVVGPANLPARGVVLELLSALPFVDVESGLTERQAAVLWQLRVPRVALGAMVGAALAVAGASYQGVFRNPLADPYLLGVAAGAGLGATIAIAIGVAGTSPLLPLAAFSGGAIAVVITYALARLGGTARTTATLILAGVAVASFFTAAQTFAQQLASDTVREVFAWILGRLTTSGWSEVGLVAPFLAVALAVLVAHRRHLDVMAVGETEAASLGMRVPRVRFWIVAAATLATAAAVSVAGLIGFVGIIVPHTVRLMAGSSYRVIVPLSMVAGAAFMLTADIIARTVLAPSELPIGVITAFVGAPFFAVILARSSRSV